MLLELIIGAILCIVVYGRLINRIRGFPPGPPPLPLLGNILSFGRQPLHLLMLRWSKQYGPPFTVWMPSPVVVIADYQTLQETIVKQGDLFGDRALRPHQLHLNGHDAYGLIFCDNNMWREQRRFALHSLKEVGFLSARLEWAQAKFDEFAYIQYVEESAKTYAQQIVEDWKKEGSDGNPIDVTENISYGMGNIIWQLSFGRTLEFKHPLFILVKERIQYVFAEFFNPCVSIAEVFPFIVYLDSMFGYPFRNIRAGSGDLISIIEKELHLTEKSLDVDDEVRCYADSFLKEMRRRVQKGEPLGNFNRDQLKFAALDLWMAGFETSVTTLRFAIHFLMFRPDIQTKMQKEIDKTIGLRQIGMVDQKALPYCMATIHEIQRLAIIGEINFFRQTAQEVIVAGRKIPAGTAILPNFPSVHMDPAHFERPDYFCPERHINETGEFAKDPRITPFSFGKRACPGEAVARMEMFIMLTTFLQHCTFASPSLIPPELEIARGVIRSPMPYKVRVTARF